MQPDVIMSLIKRKNTDDPEGNTKKKKVKTTYEHLVNNKEQPNSIESCENEKAVVKIQSENNELHRGENILIQKPKLVWRKYKSENLDLDYVQLLSKVEADAFLCRCESELRYNSGQLARVQVFGKWHNIPRKQVAHGDPGLSYTFSGNTVPAQSWLPLTQTIKDKISEVTGHDFNFVLINRYKDGCDHIGEHRDDEKDLVHGHPIASLSLGQTRDFVFKHQDARGKNATRKMDTVKLELQHGSLLMMNHPTNSFWYHCLPQRKKLTGVRINMTFRKMVTGQ